MLSIDIVYPESSTEIVDIYFYLFLLTFRRQSILRESNPTAFDRLLLLKLLNTSVELVECCEQCESLQEHVFTER